MIAPHAGNENWKRQKIVYATSQIYRSPRRERELKYGGSNARWTGSKSLPTRGRELKYPWTRGCPKKEIALHAGSVNWKVIMLITPPVASGRSSLEKRELKTQYSRGLKRYQKSFPTREEWIENLYENISTFRAESLPMRGAWIENVTKQNNPASYTRRSPRGSENWNNEENNEETSEHYRSSSRERELKSQTSHAPL